MTRPRTPACSLHGLAACWLVAVAAAVILDDHPDRDVNAAHRELVVETSLNCDFSADICKFTPSPAPMAFPFVRISGTTPTANTGPPGDHTSGGTTGFYVYCETSNPNTGKTFNLNLAIGQPMQSAGVSFWYSNYGANAGTIRLQGSSDASIYSNIWTFSAATTEAWFQAVVPVSTAPSFLRFEYTSGGLKGDFALDDFAFVPQSPSPGPIPRPTLQPSFHPTPKPMPKPTPGPSPQPTFYPTFDPSPRPSPQPTTSVQPTTSSKPPTIMPAPRPVPQPTPQPSLDPTPLPTRRPTQRPTRHPSLRPTPGPSTLPTAGDTVAIAVALSFEAATAGDVTEATLLPALAGKLGGADVSDPRAIRDFQVTFTSGRRLSGRLSVKLDTGEEKEEEEEEERDEDSKGGGEGRSRRRLLAVGAAVATFEVVGSLGDLGFATAAAFQAALDGDLAGAFEDGSLAADLSAACGCAVTASSLAVAASRAFPTLKPTPRPVQPPTPEPSSPTAVPSPRPSAIHVPPAPAIPAPGGGGGGATDDKGLLGALGASAVVVGAVALVLVLVLGGCLCGVSSLANKLGKSGDEDCGHGPLSGGGGGGGRNGNVAWGAQNDLPRYSESAAYSANRSSNLEMTEMASNPFFQKAQLERASLTQKEAQKNAARAASVGAQGATPEAAKNAKLEADLEELQGMMGTGTMLNPVQMMRAKELAKGLKGYGKDKSVDAAFASLAERQAAQADERDLADLLASEGPLSPVQAHTVQALMKKRKSKTAPGGLSGGKLAPVPEARTMHGAMPSAGGAARNPGGGAAALPDYTSKDSNASFTPSELLAGLPAELESYGGPLDRNLPAPDYGTLGQGFGSRASQRLSGFSAAGSRYSQGDDGESFDAGEHDYGGPPTPRGQAGNRDSFGSINCSEYSDSSVATTAIAGHENGFSFRQGRPPQPEPQLGPRGLESSEPPPPLPARRAASFITPAAAAAPQPAPPVPLRRAASFAPPAAAAVAAAAAPFPGAGPPPVPLRRMMSQPGVVAGEGPPPVPPRLVSVDPAVASPDAPPPTPPRTMERTFSNMSTATAVASHTNTHSFLAPAPPSNPASPTGTKRPTDATGAFAAAPAHPAAAAAAAAENDDHDDDDDDDDVGGGYRAPNAAKVLAPPPAASPPDADGLPPGWQKVPDGKGNFYYVTPAGSTQWEPPSKHSEQTKAWF